MKEPWNLKWHTDQLATGGMINDGEKFNWLVENDISCVVSLDEYPDFIRKKMSEAHMSQAFRLVKEVGDPPIEELSDFIASHIVEGRKVYIHCSAGANRSPKLARAFLEKQDLYMARFLHKRAKDLNSSDSQNFLRGHLTYSGGTTLRAITALEKGLESEDDRTLFYSADALIELMDHTDHGCFDKVSVDDLRRMTSRVLEVLLRVNSEHKDEYVKILNKFDPPKY